MQNTRLQISTSNLEDSARSLKSITKTRGLQIYFILTIILKDNDRTSGAIIMMNHKFIQASLDFFRKEAIRADVNVEIFMYVDKNAYHVI